MYSLAEKTPISGEMNIRNPVYFTLFYVSIFGFQIPPSPQPKKKFLPKCPRIIKCYACKWDKDDWKHRKEVMLGRESSFVCDWQLPFPPFNESLSKQRSGESIGVLGVATPVPQPIILDFACSVVGKKITKNIPQIGGWKMVMNQSHG